MDTQWTNLLRENRTFPPSESFQAAATYGDRREFGDLIERSRRDPVGYWAEASSILDWATPWKKAFHGGFTNPHWFDGGMLNVAVNCVDRHLDAHGDRKAFIYENERGAKQSWTYRELSARVNQIAGFLETRLQLKAGDTVGIYMPVSLEAVAAMLACARIGVTHTVIFAGFSSSAVRDRLQDCGCKAILVADETYRRGESLDLLNSVREAVAQVPTVGHTVVWKRRESTVLSSREICWSEIDSFPKSHAAKAFPSNHPLFILYTSGSTGKPKGIVHGTGGYLVQAAVTAHMVLDLKPSDIYWCSADIGWVTGHSYIVYGPLANATTVFLFEGALNYPNFETPWRIIDENQITIFYTAPTAIRMFMRAGDSALEKANLGSLRLIGSVGEPINPEAWIWYQQKVGQGRCPILDTWWQTETGTMLITPVPGVTETKPGSATHALPGILADIVDEHGHPCKPDQGGFLVLRHPWPSILLGIHGDRERFEKQYFSQIPGCYFTGDGAHRDSAGYFWIQGRIDDVLNVAGHRLGTMEIESALVSHPQVAEAAVVGKPDPIKGQSVVAYVTPTDAAREGLDSEGLRKQLKAWVVQEIGAIARPETVVLTKTLPKTRSGKIMRRLLKDLAAGKAPTGDTTTLENPGLVEIIE